MQLPCQCHGWYVKISCLNFFFKLTIKECFRNFVWPQHWPDPEQWPSRWRRCWRGRRGSRNKRPGLNFSQQFLMTILPKKLSHFTLIEWSSFLERVKVKFVVTENLPLGGWQFRVSGWPGKVTLLFESWHF